MQEIRQIMKEKGAKEAIKKARELFGDKVDDILRKINLHYGDNAIRCFGTKIDDLLKGGHTLTKHGPQVTTQYLLDRLTKEGKNRASKFGSEKLMKDSITQTLNKNKDEILSWAENAGKGDRKAISNTLQEVVGGGYMLLADGKSGMSFDTKKIKVVLEAKGNGEWIILTA